MRILRKDKISAIIGKLRQYCNLASNMGFRYLAFRSTYELKRKAGTIKRKYPVRYDVKRFTTLTEWRKESPQFFFESRENLVPFELDREEVIHLREEVDNVKTGNLNFFNSKPIDIGTAYDWVTNPDTGYHYDPTKHFMDIPDLDPRNGDIKYVWEKSRFSYLYPIIRYDYHSLNDQADFVLNEILDWIDNNPLNCGPNYKCSQEISLRIMNWTFALNYYKESEYLTEDKFQKIINSIYHQLKHVEANINFSRIAVRNNHAITECLMLFLGGMLYPFFPDTKRWRRKGKRFLEKEILYQVYRDGSYLQFSMNYHRVVIQLLTWYLILAEKNDIVISDRIKDRIQKTLDFLVQHQDEMTGWLPNYGANDGALFFKFNNCHYRDYRPQLNALHYYFNRTSLYENDPVVEEDIFWLFNEKKPQTKKPSRTSQDYNKGGFYVMRKPNSFLTVRCASFKDRPSQADNLHIDLWHEGVNIFRDAGSYKYNTKKEDLAYFMGTASHNTVMLGEHDQMLKGGRFIWYYWPKAKEAKLEESADSIQFKGVINAFRQLKGGILHERIIKLSKGENKLEVIDKLERAPKQSMNQIWHPNPEWERMGVTFECFDEQGNPVEAKHTKGWYSSFYGQKEECPRLIFSSDSHYLRTIIRY